MEGNAEEEAQSIEREVIQKLDKILARLDTIITLLFDLSPDKKIGKAVSMTEKAGYLDSVGYDIGAISRMIGRPCNYTSSRLREYKARNAKSKRKKSKSVRAHAGNQKLPQTPS